MARAEGAESPLTEEQKCRISLLRNVRYHEDREAYFSTLNRVFDLFVLVSGLGTVIALSDLLPADYRFDGRWIAGATSVVGAIQLVYGLSRREGLHSDLRRRFLGLLAELEAGNERTIQARARSLYGDEPPTFHAVDAIAYNAAQTALDRPRETLLYVGPVQRRLRNLKRYEGHPFERIGAREARRGSKAAGLAWWQRKPV